MIANPLFSLISWFRKQYCHKHKYKHTNIIVNPIFSLVFSNNVNKNCFIFRIFPHIMVYGQIIKSIDFKVFFSLCVIYIKKIVILQQLLDFYRPSRTVCQTTIWIVDPWQVHLAPHWTDFLHQWILQIATSHRASISYHLYHQCGFASFYKMQSIWNTQCREVKCNQRDYASRDFIFQNPGILINVKSRDPSRACLSPSFKVANTLIHLLKYTNTK